MTELTNEGFEFNGIHIVAHSMGNYVLHYAIEHLATICPNMQVPAATNEVATSVTGLHSGLQAGPAAAGTTVKEAATSVGGLPSVPEARPAATGPAAAGPAAASPAALSAHPTVSRPSQAAGAVSADACAAGHLKAGSPAGDPGKHGLQHTAAEAAAGTAAATASSNQPPGPVGEGVAGNASGYPLRPPVSRPVPGDATAASAATFSAASSPSAHTSCCETPFASFHLHAKDDIIDVLDKQKHKKPDRKFKKGALMHHASSKQLFSLVRTIIHAAPDVGREDMDTTIWTVRSGARFHHTTPDPRRRVQPQITVYASRNDLALMVSSFLRLVGSSRDGRAGFFKRLPSWREGHMFHPYLRADVICVDATGMSVMASAEWCVGTCVMSDMKQRLGNM